MHKESGVIVKVIAHLMMPPIMLFAIYIQMHGEISPGGGFQSGVILATAVILYTLAFGDDAFLKLINIYTLRCCAMSGVMLYLLTGVLCVLLGGNFLQYSVLAKNALFGQEAGVFIIELGVGITVFSVILMLYFIFHALIEENRSQQ